MTFGSLFSGIGGMDLGLERAGLTCKWQIENNPFCLKVLKKHWPDIPKYEDITRVQPEALESVDLLAGGFPCQDVSVAGKREGLQEGNRSGLWFEFARLIRALRPRYVLVENVPGLLIQPGLGVVLGELAECGYDAEWQVLSAAAVGAPHLRKRVWIVAYASQLFSNGGDHNSRDECRPLSKLGNSLEETRSISDWWAVEPDVGRVAHGVPSRVDRLKGLGNACVPQVVEWIGRQIMTHAEVSPDGLF